MRIVTSDLALEVVLALRQVGQASLATLARTLRTSPSSVQRALEILLADQLVLVEGKGRTRTYSLAPSTEALDAVEQLAFAAIAPGRALILVATANPGVELLGLASDQVIAVIGRRTSGTDRSRAINAITKLAGMLNLEAQFEDHDDLRRRNGRGAALRRLLSSGRILVGEIDRSLPDRSAHRATAGQPIGRINPALRLPARRTIQAIKRRHCVRRLKVFGSAVRNDFRPDSDIDIAVTLKTSAPTGAADLNALAAELERRLGHDVDLMLESDLRPAVRYLVEKESVAL